MGVSQTEDADGGDWEKQTYLRRGDELHQGIAKSRLTPAFLVLKIAEVKIYTTYKNAPQTIIAKPSICLANILRFIFTIFHF